MSKRRRVRDIYGNWVLENPEEKKGEELESGHEASSQNNQQEEIHLDWRDYIALSIASLETFLLPVVVFIVVILVLAIVFVHL